jgi:hypothetical protein|tara:strand:+ start:1316 stop:1954 length:639 start_codon:yes stop_codon:yes gene_type:complete
MTGPSREDVGAMANILKAMSGDKSGLRESAQSSNTQGGEIDISPGVKQADIKAMENIMKNFASATSNVAKKVSTTLNEATKKTEKGVDVGFYSVIKTEDGAYDILDSRTKDTLFEGLRMYKSAYVIVTHLNEGKKINSDEITKIISANAVFERNYYDALQYKYSYKVAKKRQDYGKMDIAEARFSRSKAEADKAKDKIYDIFEEVESKKTRI